MDAQGLSDAEMLAIAAELGYSESAFLFPTGERQYRVRYFSPLAEVAFCGHATIATSVALGERIGQGTVHLATQAGPVPVEIVAGPAGDITAVLTSPPASTRPAHQGVDMGRPSLLTCAAIPGDTRVKVSGTAVPIP
ncbi:PhzF family phenazine biosynthesis protein [Nonomuraea polychroma]|uniref:PhzF family phenazine biosynthesis protein n=1 Tax=Nonomuraea polychroma TaxID=46176 RepID=UPI003D8C043D